MMVTLAQAQADLAGLIRRLAPGKKCSSPKTRRRLRGSRPSRPFRRAPGPGLGKGMIEILEDDDEHLKDFEEYMR